VQAEPPAAPKPNPQPPSAQEAAQILAEAWSDPDWGTLVWLAMVTGVRRGELCGIRWRHIELHGGVLALDRSIGQRSSQTWEKDTKTHQHRRIALDPETVGVLVEHRRRCDARAAAFDLELGPDAFVFSLAPDGSTYLQPNSVSQRYAKLVQRLGIRTSIHKLRHYSATELIAAGVDVRTVAGRLGHGGGGTTTLRTYAAWVSESDQRAATSLFARMPSRPAAVTLPAVETDGPIPPYKAIAGALRSAIEAGEIPLTSFLPSVKAIAATYTVSVGTAHRAISLLRSWRHVDVEPGRGVRVIWHRSTRDDADPSTPASDTISAESIATVTATASPQWLLLNLEVRRDGQTVSRLMAEADPRNAVELRRLLIDAVRRDGRPETTIGDYEMDLRDGTGQFLGTFVAAAS